LNDVYASVATELRHEILKRYESVSPQELDAALERSKNRLAKAYGALPPDMDAAQRQLRKLERERQLTPTLLVRLMREGVESKTLFLLVFGKLADAEYPIVARVFEGRDVDALALLCRAAGFDRALFVTLSLSLAGEDRGIAKVDEFGALYERVPVLSAQRAVRFWKVRAKA
jgi:uncharacterized protein (DUF2336 family)